MTSNWKAATKATADFQEIRATEVKLWQLCRTNRIMQQIFFSFVAKTKTRHALLSEQASTFSFFHLLPNDFVLINAFIDSSNFCFPMLSQSCRQLQVLFLHINEKVTRFHTYSFFGHAQHCHYCWNHSSNWNTSPSCVVVFTFLITAPLSKLSFYTRLIVRSSFGLLHLKLIA